MNTDNSAVKAWGGGGGRVEGAKGEGVEIYNTFNNKSKFLF